MSMHMKRTLGGHGWLLAFAGVTSVSGTMAQDFAAIRKATEDSVVFVHSTRKNKDGTGISENSYGTGFVISRDGHIVTASHVILRPDDRTIVENKAAVRSRHAQFYKLELVKRDDDVDVALLMLPDVGVRWRPVKRGNSKSVPKDALLYTLGFPGSSDLSPATGILSNKFGPRGIWQTTLPINPGNSGGPVFDINGKLIAIASGGNDALQQVTYAIPEAYAEGLIQLAYAHAAVSTEIKWAINVTPDLSAKAAVAKFTFYGAVDHDASTVAAEVFCLPSGYSVDKARYAVAAQAGLGALEPIISKDRNKDNCVRVSAFIQGAGVSKIGPIVVDHNGRGWLGVDMVLEGKKAGRN